MSHFINLQMAQKVMLGGVNLSDKPIKVVFEDCCVCPADTSIICQYSKLSSNDVNESTIITIGCDKYLKEDCIIKKEMGL